MVNYNQEYQLFSPEEIEEMDFFDQEVVNKFIGRTVVIPKIYVCELDKNGKIASYLEIGSSAEFVSGEKFVNRRKHKGHKK